MEGLAVHSSRWSRTRTLAVMFASSALLWACSGDIGADADDEAASSGRAAGAGAGTSGPGGSTASGGAVCDDGSCAPGAGENCVTCHADCGACAPSCGDASCDSTTENCVSCPGDCGACAPSCGDASCDGSVGESCINCPTDCGACPPMPTCGDTSCDSGAGETCSTCPGDCGACPPYCGDAGCNNGEDCVSCQPDCGACGAPDYLPGAGYLYGVGAGGAWLSAPGGSAVDVNDAANAWNAWTGTSKLVTNGSGCGSTTSCIVFAKDGTTIFIEGQPCAVPEVPPGAWAVAHIEAGGYQNVSCGIGTQQHPLFVVAVNDEMAFNQTQLMHIGRHETGHALQLWDESAACFWSSGWYFPLMNNGTFSTCPSYPENVSATANEFWAAKLRNGW